MLKNRLRVFTTGASLATVFVVFQNCGSPKDFSHQDLSSTKLVPSEPSQELSPHTEVPPGAEEVLQLNQPSVPAKQLVTSNPPVQVSPQPGSRGRACPKYPLFPKAISRTCGGYNLKEIKGKTGGEELYVFSMYNASDSTHGWVTKQAGLKLERYKAAMDVVIPAGKARVNLVLSAYEPTVWRISGATERVKKVIAQGYHCQEVQGVDARIVQHRSAEANGHQGYFGGAEGSGSQLKKHVEGIEKELGLAITKAQYVYEGSCIDLNFKATP